jgi:YesN/AraC family two-component response regulator
LILFIKNTTTFESLMFVRNELNRLSLPGVSVEINEIRTDEKLTAAQYGALRGVLKQAGVEFFEDKKDILVQRIKNVIMDVVYHSEEQLVHNLSTHLTEELNHDYTYMSNLFSETQHVTIERFYIFHKIERVKELLLYEKMKLTEIAHVMHYSSLAHLSNQFKKVTGLTTSQFKQQSCKNL